MIGSSPARSADRGYVRRDACQCVEAPRDFEGLRGRSWSSSYVFRGVRDPEGFDRALRSLFDAHARDGAIEFPYRGVGLVFRVSTAASIASAIRS
jgi:hypothetical protein